jgi:hypothetical protein
VGNENGQNVLSIEETHERCEIHTPKKHGVNTTDEFCGYGYEQ